VAGVADTLHTAAKVVSAETTPAMPEAAVKVTPQARKIVVEAHPIATASIRGISPAQFDATRSE
jgi:cytoskeletal protein RodZ